MDTLSNSWKSAWQLCSMANARVIMRETFALMREVVRVLLAPWLFLTIIVIVALGTLLGGMVGFFGSLMFAFLIPASILFLIAARRTSEQKDFAYFRRCIVRAMLPIIIMLVIGIIPVVSLIFTLLPGFFDLYILMYLDRKSDLFATLKQAFFTIIYNYPFWFIYIIGFDILIKIIMFLPSLIMGIGAFGVGIMTRGPGVGLLILFGFVAMMMALFFELFMKCLVVVLYEKYVKRQDQFHVRPEMNNE